METITGENQSNEPSTNLPVQRVEYRYEEDTISLIDLVAVLIRHRMMIIIGIILVGIIVATSLYVGPTVGFEIGPEPEYTAQQQILVESIPLNIRQRINVDPAIRLQSILNDPRFVGEVYAPFETDAPADRPPERYLTMILRDIIGNAYNVTWDSETNIFTLQYTASTPDDATEFLDAMILQSTRELSNQINPQIESAKTIAERTLAESSTRIVRLTEQALLRTTSTLSEEWTNEVLLHLEGDGALALSAFITVIGEITMLEELIAESDQIAIPFGLPVVFEETPRSRSIIVIIAIALAFFVMVFLGFVFEYLHHIRQEPKAMQKLLSAWRRE